MKIEPMRIENRQDKEWGWGFLVRNEISNRRGRQVLSPSTVVKESKIYGLSCECSAFIFNRADRECLHTEAVKEWLNENNRLNEEHFSSLKEKILLREI